MSNLAESSDVNPLDLKSEQANVYSINVIKRIIHILYENGSLKRTNLAGMSGLNYNKCIRYLNLLHALGWIKVMYDDGSCFVAVTDRGIESA
ncbi:MAG: winged helix-turn-helix domain-containing protein, partial [Thaumarchaeota archaeon]|nr:winged helix-turn-helix domain-containing protein [Nitrososphaerota archaeon]